MVDRAVLRDASELRKGSVSDGCVRWLQQVTTDLVAGDSTKVLSYNPWAHPSETSPSGVKSECGGAVFSRGSSTFSLSRRPPLRGTRSHRSDRLPSPHLSSLTPTLLLLSPMDPSCHIVVTGIIEGGHQPQDS